MVTTNAAEYAHDVNLRYLLNCLGLSACLLSCGGSGGGGKGEPDAAPPAITARAVFEPVVPGSGAAWGTIPFPSDLFLADDGGIAMTELPSGPDASAVAIEQMKEALRAVKGAGVNAPIFFPVEGAVDPTSLAGNVVVIDLGSGTEVATDLQFRADLGAIVAAPQLGTALRENTRYGAYITTGVKDSSGAALQRSDAFGAAMALDSTPADPAVAAAQQQLRPLLEAIEVAPEELVVATVFRTEHITHLTKRMRDIVAASPPMLINLDDILVYGPEPEELDDLFGVQDPDAVAGHEHFASRPQPHGSVAAVVHATVDLPSFLSAEFATDGVVELNEDGDPIVKGTQPVRMTLVLPRVDDYENLPVVFFVHGMNRTRADVLALAEPAARRGFAVAAIDLLHHGDRRMGATDSRNDTTGEMSPDGFADRVELLGAVGFFHMTNSGGYAPYHPLPMRENFRQAAVDLCSLAAFLRDGDLSPIVDALAAGGLQAIDLSFRGDSLAIVTESFGSMMSLLAMAVEPSFDIAMLASPASSFPYPTLVHSANFSNRFTGILIRPHDVDDRVVLGDPVMGARWEPVLALWNTVMQTGDPIVYAPYILTGELRGDPGANLILAEVWGDEWVPNDAVEHLVGVLGLPVLELSGTEQPPGELFRYVDLPMVQGPIEGNVSNGRRTAVHTVWYPAAHALVRKISEGMTFEPDFPPFTRRAEEWRFESPIEEVQLLWGRFLSDFWAGDEAPEAFDPFAVSN